MIKLYKQNYLVYLLIIYWIIQVILEGVGIIGRSSSAIITKVFLLLLFLFLLLVYSIKNRMLIHKKTFFVWMWFVCIQAIIIINSLINYPYFNVKDLITPLYSIVFSFFFFIILYGQEFSNNQLKLFLNIFIKTMTLICIINIITSFSHFISVISGNIGYGSEMSGIFESNHVFGYYIYLSLSSVIYFYKKYGEIKYISILVLTLNLFVSLSRTSFISLIVFLVVFFLLISKNPLKIIKVVLSMILAFMLCISIKPLNNLISAFLIKNIDLSAGLTNILSGRNIIHSYAMNLLSKNFILGYGYSYPEKIMEQTIEHGSFHSTYYDVLLSGGILLFSFFVILILLSILNGKRILINDRITGSFFIALILSLLAYGSQETLVPFSSMTPAYLESVMIVILPMFIKNHILLKKL